MNYGSLNRLNRWWTEHPHDPVYATAKENVAGFVVWCGDVHRELRTLFRLTGVVDRTHRPVVLGFLEGLLDLGELEIRPSSVGTPRSITQMRLARP